MIPDEDLGPRWLRKDNFDDFGDIKADIDAMKQFAARLTSNVESNYGAHIDQVLTPMQTILPSPPGEFVELVSFLQVHRDAQNDTQKNVFRFYNTSLTFANAAGDIGKKYAGSDAFAHAKVSDVNKELAAGGPSDQVVK
jgi:hypothetical protein